MNTAGENLDRLLEELELRVRQSDRRDAIDEVLAGEARTTAVRSLRNHEVVQRFRQELSDGLIQVDTAGRLLDLIRTIVSAVTG
jgi:hypothetical protein